MSEYLAQVRAAFPDLDKEGYSDEEVAIWFADSTGQDRQEIGEILGVYNPNQGDFSRGVSAAVDSTQGMLYGAGALAADTVGADDARNSMVRGYQKNMSQIELRSKPTDSYEGINNFGDATAFAKYYSGYGLAQGAQAIATGGLGGIIGKQVVKQGLKRAGKDLLEGSSRTALEKGARIGSYSGFGSQAVGTELGATYGGAVDRALETGQSIDDINLEKVYGYGTAAGLVEGAADIATAGLARFGPAKNLMESVNKARNRATNIATKAGKGAVVEGVTEGIQTGLEDLGAGYSAEESRFFDPTSVLAGAIGGGQIGAIGGLRGNLSTPSSSETRISLQTELGAEDAQLQEQALAEEQQAAAAEEQTNREKEALAQSQDLAEDAVYERRVAAAASFTPKKEFDKTRAAERKAQQELDIANPDTELGQEFNASLKAKRSAGGQPLYDPAEIKAERAEFLKGYNKTTVDADKAEDAAAYEQALDLHAESLANGDAALQTAALTEGEPTAETAEAPNIQTAKTTKADQLRALAAKKLGTDFEEKYPELSILLKDTSNTNSRGAKKKSKFESALNKVLKEQPAVEQPAVEQAPAVKTESVSPSDAKPSNVKLSFTEDAELRSGLKPQQQKVYNAVLKAASENTLGELFSVSFESGTEATTETSNPTSKSAVAAKRATQRKLLKAGGVQEKTLVKVFKQTKTELSAKDREKYGKKSVSQPIPQFQQVKILEAAGVSSDLINEFTAVSKGASKTKAAKTRGFKVEANNARLKTLSGIENVNSASTATSAVISKMRARYGNDGLKEMLTRAGVSENSGVSVADAATSADLVSEGGLGLSTVGSAGGSQGKGASSKERAANKAKDVKSFKDAGMTDEQIDAYYNKETDAASAENELAKQVLEDIENAKFAIKNADKLLRAEWNANNAADGPSYDDLTLNNKIDWMETVYATLGESNKSAVLAEKANSLRGITDATTQDNESGRTEVQESSGETASTELPEDTGRGTEADAKPAESDGESFTAGKSKTVKIEKKTRRKVIKRREPKFSIGLANGTGFFNDDDYAVFRIQDAIEWYIGKSANWRTTVVKSPNDLIGLVLSKKLNIDGYTLGEVLDQSSAQGVVLQDNDGVERAFFFAENIPAGKETGVIAHELGGHIGMDNVLTDKQLVAATQKIRKWAASEGNSLEKAISERALARAISANAEFSKRFAGIAAGPNANEQQKANADELSKFIDQDTEERVRFGTDEDSEVIAYFLEEATNAGITPNSDSDSDLVTFIRQLWSDFKRALRRLRPDNETALSAQDLVNMARGAARLELATDFHGASAPFRKANQEYFGLGRNAFGVGFYVSEDQGEGTSYMFERTNQRNTATGVLQRIDNTVAENEFVLWKNPLSTQSDILAKLEKIPDDVLKDLQAEMGGANLEDMTGRQLYLGLTSLQLREDTIESFIDDDAYETANKLDDNTAAAMSITSAFLRALDIKGIKVDIKAKDANPGKVFNKIIFDAADVIVIGRNDASDVDVSSTTPGSVRFSVPETEIDNQVSWARKNIGDGAGEMMTNLKKVSKKPFNATKNLDRIIRDNEKQMPSARKWYNFLLDAEVTKNNVLSMVESVINQARPISMERKELVNDFLGASTFYQKWGYDPKWVDRKTGKPVEVKIDPTMQKKYNRLSDEEKQLVRDVFSHGRTIQELMQEVAEKLGVSKFFNLESALKGPYAPLKRFGNFVGELKSKELLAAETALKNNPSPENRKALEKLKSAEDHYVISFFDTEGAAETFALANKDKYESAEFSEKIVGYEEARAGGAKVYEKILGAVNANLPGLDSTSQDAMRKMVRDMYFQTLDESNARLSGVKRLNRAGYDKDMLRSFAVHGMSQANLMAQMKHGADISGALVDAQKEALSNGANAKNLTPVYNTLAVKFQRMMTPRTGMLADLETALMKFNSFYMLTSSLGYFAQNFTQPYFAAANIAGEFGWKQGQTWGKLFNGYSVARKVINTGFLNQVTNVASMGVLGGNSTVELDINQAPPEIRPLLEQLQSYGLLDVGVTEDLRHVKMGSTVDQVQGEGVASDALRLLKKIPTGYEEMTHRLYQSARYVEANNRIASAVAAFKMAQANPQKMKRLKMTPQEFALRIVSDTQGNFSQLDAPAAFDILPKAPLQFRKYQFQMAWLHFDALKQAFKGADPATKAAGFRKFSLMMGYTGVFGGLTAVPASNIASALLQAAISTASGDDEEGPKMDLERWIRDNVDDERTATLLARGVPAALGWDFSQKLDQSDLFMPYNSKYVELDPSRDGALLVAAQLLLGPTGTIVGNMGNVADFVNRGNYYRAAEYSMPKGLRSYMETMRYADNGYTTRSELKITDPTKFDAVDFLTNAVGLPSTDINQIKWNYGQQIEIKQWFSAESSRIKRGYLAAHDDRDNKGKARYREEFRELQKAKDRVRPFFNNSQSVLKRSPISNLINAPANRVKEQRRLDSTTGR